MLEHYYSCQEKLKWFNITLRCKRGENSVTVGLLDWCGFLYVMVLSRMLLTSISGHTCSMLWYLTVYTLQYLSLIAVWITKADWSAAHHATLVTAKGSMELNPRMSSVEAFCQRESFEMFFFSTLFFHFTDLFWLDADCKKIVLLNFVCTMQCTILQSHWEQ